MERVTTANSTPGHSARAPGLLKELTVPGGDLLVYLGHDLSQKHIVQITPVSPADRWRIRAPPPGNAAHGKAAYQCQRRQTQCPSIFHMYLRCLLAPSRWAFPPAGRQYSVSYTNWSWGSRSSPRWRCPPSPSPAPPHGPSVPATAFCPASAPASRMMESRFRPQFSFTGRAIWVGRRAPCPSAR